MAERLSLLVLTDAYPFGHSENFFETELETLRRHAQVVVVPSQRCNRSTPALMTPEGVASFLDAPRTRRALASQILRSASTVPTLGKWVAQELSVRRDVWFEPRGLYLLAWFVWHAMRTFEDAKRALERHHLVPEETIAYAYWSWPSALSALLLKDRYPSLRTIARCHGGDVYEERHRPEYLPFRPLFASKLDRIAFISEHGRTYFQQRWSAPEHKLLTARLGVSAAAKRSIASAGANAERRLELVSCSYAVPVKRLELTLEVVRHVATRRALPVRWTHLGDGPTLSALRMAAAGPLPANLEVRLVGEVPPAEVVAHYEREAVDIFLNTSQNEGVPVSIMEAFSCGIPVVAPRVGGVPEIVGPACGALVDRDAPSETWADAVLGCVSAPNHHLALRDGAYERWSTTYRAEVTFERFFQELVALRRSVPVPQ